MKFLKQLSINPDYKKLIQERYGHDEVVYNSNLASGIRIENNDIFYTVDRTSGRFHSNLTNLPKYLRKCIRIKNTPLVNIDIKNCQPYLSTILLTHPNKVCNLTKNTSFALMLQSLNIPNTQDVNKYISLAVSGELYEYLMDEFAKEGLVLNRSETKSQVLRILFARNRLPQDEVNRKARQIFISRFPKVHRVFSKIRGSDKGDKFVSFKRFAILLQRIESHLILDVIIKRINKERPEIIAVTVHDSIMTEAKATSISYVQNVMKEELTRFVGFEPKLALEGILEEIKENERRYINYNQYGATTSVSAY